MSNNPIRIVDLNFNRIARPSKEVAILREDSIKYYHATKTSLRRLACVCRRNHEGFTYPFADGWQWAKDKKEEKGE